MPVSCCIVGCVTRYSGTKSKPEGISFFRIPVNVHQRRAWGHCFCTEKLRSPKSWERVCSKHFVSGWPIDDRNDVDYKPTVLMKEDRVLKRPRVLVLLKEINGAAKRAERHIIWKKCLRYMITCILISIYELSYTKHFTHR